MTNEPEDELTTALQSAGSSWRAEQPDVPGLDLRRLENVRVASPRRRTVIAAAAAACIAVVVATTVPVILSKGRDGRTPVVADSVDARLAEWALAADTGSGIRVQAVGSLIRTNSGLMLCAFGRATLPVGASTTTCGVIGVQVFGADVGSAEIAPGSTNAAGVRVTGVYHDGVLDIVSGSYSPGLWAR